MTSEKTDALVIRLADFSESSRVVTFFSRDFGKISALAKGAKRLKSAFEAALDLLSNCRIVFLPKSGDRLNILTEAQLVRHFRPIPKSLFHLYGGYYVAELLNGLTEDHDPHPRLFDLAAQTLGELSSTHDPRLPIITFELGILREIGQLPPFDACSLCGTPLPGPARLRVSPGGLICPACGRPELEHTEVSAGTIAILQRLNANEFQPSRLVISPQQFRELRRIVTAAVSHAMERRPKMLAYLKFETWKGIV